jgi:multidrug transporter EmrE-like cation transporter
MTDSRSRWFPIAFVLLSSCSVTAAEVFLKLGATTTAAASNWGLAMLLNPWIIAGILAYVGGLALWLIGLPHMALHLAYGLAAIVHLLVPLASWIFLHESIPVGRLAGMFLILTGSIVLSFAHE